MAGLAGGRVPPRIAPENPASRRQARYASTVRLNGRSGRRIVSPIRMISWVTPSATRSGDGPRHRAYDVTDFIA